MKTIRRFKIGFIFLAIISLGGCNHVDKRTLGTAAGAAVGGTIGGLAGGTTGAVIGGVGGAVIGSQLTKNKN